MEADEEEDDEASFAAKRKSAIFVNKLEDLEVRLDAGVAVWCGIPG